LYEYYISSGVCKTPEKSGGFSGFAEVILYNPSEDTKSHVEITAYFEDRPPADIKPIDIKPGQNRLLVMPDCDPETFENCGYFGARFISTTPLVVEPIGGPSMVHENNAYQGGCPNFWGTKLHKQWHFADGYWIVHEKPDKDALFPFNEDEEYYYLNPGKNDATLDITLQFRNIEHMRFQITVKAERLLVWRNHKRVPYGQPHGLKVVSSEPVSAASTRFIYGMFNGYEEWGWFPHCAMPGVPGPIR